MIYSTQLDSSGAERYEFFAKLFLQEPDETSLAAWQQEPHLAPAFPTTLRDLRIEFTRLFSLSVFPYASVFLDGDAFMNTETTARVEAAYQLANFAPDPALPIGAPDHFGLELAFVGNRLKSGQEVEASKFLQSEILPWAGLFLHAVEKNAREALYRLAAHDALEWLGRDGANGEIQATREIGPIPEMDDEDDLDSVISNLLIPAHAGLFLSKEEISSMARRVEVPLGFGDRALMLKSLFRAAGEYGRIEELLRLLQAEADEWVEFYAQATQLFPAGPAMAGHWLKLAAATLERLDSMEQMANGTVDDAHLRWVEPAARGHIGLY